MVSVRCAEQSRSFIPVFLCGMLAAFLVCPHSAISATGSPKDLVAVLKARDSQFDNVRLAYTMAGVKQLKDYSWRRLDKKPKAPAPPRSVEYVYKDQMIVRGSDITFVRDQDPPAITQKSPWKTMHWNNFEGIRTELVLYDQQFSHSPGTVEIHRNPINSPDGESQHRMLVEEALGFGYGRRLIEFSSAERTDSGYVARGPMKLWRNDKSECELEIDDDFIVRKAVIDTDVKGVLTRIEVTSTGKVERGGFLFAERGHYLRRHEGKLVDGKKVGTSRVEAEYDITFDDAEFNLADKQYSALTMINLPVGTTVVDPNKIGITNVDCVKWASSDQTNPASSLTKLAFWNAIVVTAVLVFVWLRGRRRVGKTVSGDQR